MIDNPICYFHPDKVAIVSCERCHKLICQADKKKAIKYLLPGQSFKKSNSSITLCPPCYFENVEINKAKYDQKKINTVIKTLTIFALVIPVIIILTISLITPSEKSRLIFVLSAFVIGIPMTGMILFYKKKMLNINKKAIEEFDKMQEDKTNFYGNLEHSKINP